MCEESGERESKSRIAESDNKKEKKDETHCVHIIYAKR